MSVRFPAGASVPSGHEIGLATSRKLVKLGLADVLFVGMILISVGGLTYALLH